MKDEVRRCLVAIDVSDRPLRARFDFPSDLAVFAGHFPGVPIVPGVYLIECVRIVCERAAGRSLRIAAVDEAKFTAETGPGEDIEVEASFTEEAGGWSCRATVVSAKGQAALLRLRLTAES